MMCAHAGIAEPLAIAPDTTDYHWVVVILC